MEKKKSERERLEERHRHERKVEARLVQFSNPLVANDNLCLFNAKISGKSMSLSIERGFID